MAIEDRQKTLAELHHVPPKMDENAERALLGSLILDSTQIGEISTELSRHDFAIPKHAEIYAAIVRRYDKSGSLDVMMLIAELDDAKSLADVGGAEYLADLVASCPVAGNAKFYAERVKDTARCRQIVCVGSRIVQIGQDDSDPQSALDTAQEAFYGLTKQIGDEGPKSLHDLLGDSMEWLIGGGEPAISTGFPSLDDILGGGFHDGQMIVLAARPGMGKSALALTIGRNIAAAGNGVILFSLEMSKKELGARLISIESNVSFSKLRRCFGSKDEINRAGAGVGRLDGYPFYIDDQGGLSIFQVRSKLRHAMIKHKPKIAIVDYMQLMSGSSNKGGSNRQEEVAEISRGMKSLARECGIPILCLSQLSRKVEDRGVKRPQLADLRESGSIEQDADVVAMLYREDYYNRDEPDYCPTEKTELIIAKQRNGPAGTVDLRFNGSAMRFEEMQ